MTWQGYLEASLLVVSDVLFGGGSYTERCRFIFSGCSRPQSFLGFSQMRWRPLPSPGAIGCGEVKGNGSSDGADIREPEEPRAFYCRSAFLKVWAGNPSHRNQLELTLKYRLLFPIRDLLNPNLRWGSRTCSLHKHVQDS